MPFEMLFRMSFKTSLFVAMRLFIWPETSIHHPHPPWQRIAYLYLPVYIYDVYLVFNFRVLSFNFGKNHSVYTIICHFLHFIGGKKHEAWFIILSFHSFSALSCSISILSSENVHCINAFYRSICEICKMGKCCHWTWRFCMFIC